MVQDLVLFVHVQSLKFDQTIPKDEVVILRVIRRKEIEDLNKAYRAVEGSLYAPELKREEIVNFNDLL